MNGPSPLLRIAFICAAIVIGAVIVGSQLSTGTLSQLVSGSLGPGDSSSAGPGAGDAGPEGLAGDEYGAGEIQDGDVAEEAFLDESADDTAEDSVEDMGEDTLADEDAFASDEDMSDEAEEEGSAGDPDEL